MEKLFVIGFGPGDEALLTGRAKDAIDKARRVLSTGRISSADERIKGLSLSDLMSELSKTGKGDTAVLVSGDSGFFSAARSIVRDSTGTYEIEVLPGISAFQYLSAKLKIPYDDAVLVSLHGREINIVPKAAYNKKVFALTGGENDVREICRTLSRYGLGHVRVSVGERLSYPDERIVTKKADKLKDMEFDPLSVLYIENPGAVDPFIPLKDSDFVRKYVPMTKEEVRWLSINKLEIRPEDVVFDIGAGTGSVSVEMARKACGGFVYAIEAKENACALVRKNAVKHGAFNIEIVEGEAPSALKGLPIPDKAFIGGSAGNMDGILKDLVCRNPEIKIVANAITLQTLSQIHECFEKNGIACTDTICVNIAKAKKVGRYDFMTAQNPVYIVAGKGGICRE